MFLIFKIIQLLLQNQFVPDNLSSYGVEYCGPHYKRANPHYNNGMHTIFQPTICNIGGMCCGLQYFQQIKINVHQIKIPITLLYPHNFESTNRIFYALPNIIDYIQTKILILKNLLDLIYQKKNLRRCSSFTKQYICHQSHKLYEVLMQKQFPKV